MRKLLPPPLATTLSALMLIVLAACGFGLRAAQGHPTKLPAPLQPLERSAAWLRATCAAPQSACGQAVSSTLGATVMILALRSKDSLRAIDAAAQAETPPITNATTHATVIAEAPAALTVATALPRIITECAALLGLWLVAMTMLTGPRPRGATLPLPLRRITEHRVAPAP